MCLIYKIMLKGGSSNTKRKKKRMNDTSEAKKKNNQEASNKVNCDFIIVSHELKIRRKWSNKFVCSRG